MMLIVMCCAEIVPAIGPRKRILARAKELTGGKEPGEKASDGKASAAGEGLFGKDAGKDAGREKEKASAGLVSPSHGHPPLWGPSSTPAPAAAPAASSADLFSEAALSVPKSRSTRAPSGDASHDEVCCR